MAKKICDRCKGKATWQIEISRPPVEVYSPDEGIRRFEPDENIGLLVTVTDQKGIIRTISVSEIKPTNFMMTTEENENG